MHRNVLSLIAMILFMGAGGCGPFRSHDTANEGLRNDQRKSEVIGKNSLEASSKMGKEGGRGKK